MFNEREKERYGANGNEWKREGVERRNGGEGEKEKEDAHQIQLFFLFQYFPYIERK